MKKSSVTQPFQWHYRKISVPLVLSYLERTIQFLFLTHCPSPKGHYSIYSFHVVLFEKNNTVYVLLVLSSRRTIQYLFLSCFSPLRTTASYPLVLFFPGKSTQYLFLSCCLLGEGQYSTCSSCVVLLFGKGTEKKTTSFQNKSNHLKMECKLKWWMP